MRDGVVIKRSDGLETRRRVLDAAGKVFAARGFRDATVADICRSAGANVAAVNYHFGSKRKLYVEAWRHAFHRSMAAYPPDGGVRADAPAEERLRGQVRALMQRIMDPASLEFDIVHKEMAQPTGLLLEVLRRSVEPLRRRLRDVVRELLGRGARDERVQLCVMSIHAQCFAPHLRERQRKRMPYGSRLPPALITTLGLDAVVDHIVRFSLAGIRGVEGRSRAGSMRKKTGRTGS